MGVGVLDDVVEGDDEDVDGEDVEGEEEVVADDGEFVVGEAEGGGGGEGGKEVSDEVEGERGG